MLQGMKKAFFKPVMDGLEKASAAKTARLIFAFFFLSRCLFKWVTGHDNFELFGDSYRYDIFSDQLLSGNFNLDGFAFIIAPLYPYFLAGMKLLFGAYWQTAAVVVQFAVVSWSGVWLYRLALLVFQRRSVALLTAIFYGLFPNTLWLNYTLSQETLFQSFFIGSVYYLVAALKDSKDALIRSAVLFSLAFLTKSHCLLYSPFIALLFLLQKKRPFSRRLYRATLYAVICLAFTVPYGLYNLRVNGLYVLSSTGFGSNFHMHHSDEGYKETFPVVDSLTGQRIPGILFAFYRDYDFGKYGKVNRLPQKEMQAMHWRMAREWISANPRKFLELKWFAFRRFFTPGLSKAHYPFNTWLASFLLGLPVYMLAYFGLWKAFRTHMQDHWWMAFLVFTLFFFFVFFWPMSRFRTITLEPFYLMYAAYALENLLNRYREKDGAKT